ncbi:MAG: pteridine reductase [Betaproteobacteria bacterium]|nr:MAG: pteridine reductase [Betaproteobacteria bacterium]
MDDSLQGQVALVTGAARRVGAAIARRLHASGANVVVHYRGAEREAAELEAELNAARKGSALRLKGDLLAPIAPQALVGAALERWNRLDLLVNNASTFYATAVGEIEAAQWEELIGSNLRAPLFLAQTAAPHLAATRGSIVNIVDIHAERPLKGYLLYSVAKAGLAALTRALALELAPQVRVNAVAPGAIAWPENGQFEPGERERIVATTPLRRTGTPEDIAQAVHYLATAPFVNGHLLAVDGGRSLHL